jgi:hypothetical protein
MLVTSGFAEVVYCKYFMAKNESYSTFKNSAKSAKIKSIS